MKAAFHKYVKVTAHGIHYCLHIVERADGLNLYFATDFNGRALGRRRTAKIVTEYKAGNFENAEENLDRCPAKL